MQANLRAGLVEPQATGAVYNVAFGQRTTLLELFTAIRERLAGFRPTVAKAELTFRDFREGDVRHSLADISAARTHLHYEPTHDVRAGLDAAIEWYVDHLQ